MEQTTDTLQAYIERWTEGTYLQWKFDDAAAENREWNVEWIYLFILAFAIYLAAAAIINKIKQRKNENNKIQRKESTV